MPSRSATASGTPPAALSTPSRLWTASARPHDAPPSAFARLDELCKRGEDIEMLYRLPDLSKRKLFVTRCRRDGLTPYRESGRRKLSAYTTEDKDPRIPLPSPPPPCSPR